MPELAPPITDDHPYITTEAKSVFTKIKEEYGHKTVAELDQIIQEKRKAGEDVPYELIQLLEGKKLLAGNI